MLHNLQFDLGKHSIWCEIEVVLNLESIDHMPCVTWKEVTRTMAVDTLKKNINIDLNSLRNDNFERIQETINEKVASLTIADYSEIKSNNKGE